MTLGLWILAGLLTFVVVEIMFSIDRDMSKDGIQVTLPNVHTKCHYAYVINNANDIIILVLKGSQHRRDMN
jgi:hypothetical protein